MAAALPAGGAADSDLPLDISQLQDVSSSAAYQVLNTLLDDSAISADRADAAKAAFARLHGGLLAAMSRETALLQQAKQLKRKLDADARSLEAGLLAESGGGSGSSGSESASGHMEATLREDVEAALAEAALAQERQQLLALELADLQRERNELAAQGQAIAAEHAAALQPVVEAVQAEVEALQEQVAADAVKVAAVKADIEALKAGTDQVARDMEALNVTKGHERAALSKVEGLPDKARRHSEAVAGALRNVQGQMDSAQARLGDADGALKAARARQQEVEEEHARLLTALDRGRVQVEAKERHCDDVRKDVELAGIEADKILADQVELDIRIKGAVASLRAEQEALARKQREKELALRQLKAAEATLSETQDGLPNLKFQVEQLQRDKAAAEVKIRAQAKALDEVKRDLDISMNEFLKEETIGKEKAAMFAVTAKQVSVMEGELREVRRQEGERAKVLADLGSQRDRVALSIAHKLAKVKEVQLAARIKEVELAELRKIRKDTVRRIRDYEQLYALVKAQRNKFVNLIQAAHQAAREMRDKSKILGNEQDILQSEVTMKDKLLSQSRSQHAVAVGERDTLRIELGKYGATFRDKQDVVDEQIAEVDKLNAIINLTEKDMIKLRKQYEVVIEARNATGIMLIDRNDELCILYEKAAVQDAVLRAGTLEMNAREDELRVLRLEVAALERSVAATAKVVPQIPALDQDVARLQKALLEARREAEALSLALESPDNAARWRLLDGKIPDKEELAAKLQQLEERLSAKKEALLEKELVLEEVSSLADKLRAQASGGKSEQLALAKAVNETQNRLRATTRRIMATVSELSMYQATSLKLGAEKEEMSATVSTAAQRIDAGLPPSEEAEREWERLCREQDMLASMAETRAEDAAALDAQAPAVQSTAELRPNAYIPETLGIPKPYGTFSPFKPSEAGSTMRHMRKPQPREIII